MLNNLKSLNDKTILESIENKSNWALDAINAPEAWTKTKGKGVKVLIIDTGINGNHEQLKDAFQSGYNFFERSFDVEDRDGHGTHIAGLIAGRDLGVAPEVELHVVKVLSDDGRGTMASVMDGFTYAINYDFDVISISLGIPNKLPIIFQERIAQAYNAGITMVCATGNSGNSQAMYPARMDEVIAVGGLDKDMNVAPFTNGEYDVLAPAVDILSTYKDGLYAELTGTSMASPLVAGGIALMISHYRNEGFELYPEEIMELLKKLDNKVFDLSKLMS